MLACSPFVTVDEVLESACACDLNEDDHGDIIDEFADDASDILYVLSNGRVTGRCTRTIRPFRAGVLCGPGGLFGWGVDRQNWINFDSVDSIPLQGPNTEITEVVIDGLLIDPSEYGLLNGNKLFRRGNLSWPSDNDITLDDTEEGTFAITYRFGNLITLSTKRAAIELICQMVISPTMSLNRLRGVVSANVQGVSVQLDTDEVRSMGLPEVSKFLDIYGGPVRAAWSPELDHGWRLLQVAGPSGS